MCVNGLIRRDADVAVLKDVPFLGHHRHVGVRVDGGDAADNLFDAQNGNDAGTFRLADGQAARYRVEADPRSGLDG